MPRFYYSAALLFTNAKRLIPLCLWPNCAAPARSTYNLGYRRTYFTISIIRDRRQRSAVFVLRGVWRGVRTPKAVCLCIGGIYAVSSVATQHSL